MASDERAGNPAPRRRPGELETEIITVLVAAARAMTPAEVRERIDPSAQLSYSAVVTTLTRLHDKAIVTRTRDGRAYRYAAVADASALVAWRMGRLLDTQSDHDSVLARFVGSLSKNDEAILRRLLPHDDA